MFILVSKDPFPSGDCRSIADEIKGEFIQKMKPCRPSVSRQQVDVNRARKAHRIEHTDCVSQFIHCIWGELQKLFVDGVNLTKHEHTTFPSVTSAQLLAPNSKPFLALRIAYIWVIVGQNVRTAIVRTGSFP